MEAQKKCPCHAYEERVAIMQYDGKMNEEYARKAARQDTCLGCQGSMGIDLFEKRKTI